MKQLIFMIQWLVIYCLGVQYQFFTQIMKSPYDIANSISYFGLSSDQSRIIAYPYQTTNYRAVNFYTIDKGNTTFISQFYAYDSTMSSYFSVKMNLDISLIVCFCPFYHQVRILKRTQLTIALLQDIFPLPNQLDTLDISADATNLIVGIHSTRELVSYIFNGSQYILDANITLPTRSIIRAISPDGRYILYSQNYAVLGTCYLRILQNFATHTQVYNTNFSFPSAPTTAIIQKIIVSMPQSGIYDIVSSYRLNSITQTVYFTFDSNLNTGTFIQTIRSSTLSINSLILTKNGKYVGILQSNFPSSLNSIIIYQKLITGSYSQIYANIQLFFGISLLHITEDASLIVVRANAANGLLFFYICNINNCYKCSWKNTCQKCDPGYDLVNNTCVCSSLTYNVSSVCVNCSGANCIECSANQVCSRCQNGYSLNLQMNLCVCGQSKNISLITGKCVTCIVSNCYLCSYDNICDTFWPINLQPTQNMVISQLVAIVIIVLGLVGGSVFLYKLIKPLLANVSIQNKHSNSQNYQKKSMDKINNIDESIEELNTNQKTIQNIFPVKINQLSFNQTLQFQENQNVSNFKDYKTTQVRKKRKNADKYNQQNSIQKFNIDPLDNYQNQNNDFNQEKI